MSVAIIYGIRLLIEKEREGEIYNIGNDQETRIIDLARTVIDVTGSRSEIAFMELPPDDPLRRAADISRMKALGWTPVTPLREGISRTMLKLARD